MGLPSVLQAPVLHLVGDLVEKWYNARLRTVHRQLDADRFPRVRGCDRDVVAWISVWTRNVVNLGSFAIQEHPGVVALADGQSRAPLE
jgi:hypothetical protein